MNALLDETETQSLLVKIYSPSGNCFEVIARDAEHAEWLKRMNPKYSQKRIDDANKMAAIFEAAELKSEVAA